MKKLFLATSVLFALSMSYGCNKSQESGTKSTQQREEINDQSINNDNMGTSSDVGASTQVDPEPSSKPQEQQPHMQEQPEMQQEPEMQTDEPEVEE